MNYIDVALIVIIVVIGFRGFATGFVSEASSFVGVVLGVFLASMFGVHMGKAVQSLYDFNSPTIHYVFGFITILLLCMFIFWTIGFVISKKLQLTGLNFLNKGLGFVFASIKVFFVFSFIVYAISQISFLNTTFKPFAEKHSQMYVSMMKVAGVFIKLPVVNQTIENLQNATTNPAGDGQTLQETGKKTLESITSKASSVIGK